MATNKEEKAKYDYAFYAMIIAIVGLIISTAKFILDIYFSPIIPENMKSIIVLIILASICFVYLILKQITIQREFNALKEEFKELKGEFNALKKRTKC